MTPRVGRDSRRFAGPQRWALTIAAAGAVLVATVGAAQSTRYNETVVTVDLGLGVTATRLGARRGRARGVRWSAVGFALPTTAGLGEPTTLAPAPGGRIVAALPNAFASTDDRGRTWRTAPLFSSQQPLAMSFDPANGFGVAVGTSGAVWTSTDRGTSWALRRDGGDDDLVAVAVLGRAFVMVSLRGGVFASVDGGTSLRQLAASPEPRPATFGLSNGVLWVALAGQRMWRVYDGWIEAADR